ncbi:hypothetical protein GCM10022200_18870 [Microbacterium awajiense]|uniref:Amidohydrolase n=1 Tax=Microbacterium awajiense TaxID=415214 RepID=A0ABP7ANB1_9MICO
MAALSLREILGPHARRCHRALTGETGTALPPLIDHHVHVALIDERDLPAGGIAGILDLGGDPAALARHARRPMPALAYAGAFLTAVGGYPVGRTWAPADIVREVSTASDHPGVPGGAATEVDAQAEFGASVVKVVLHDGAPTLDDAILAAIVRRARERGLPVVAHVEGDGMTARALAAGVDALAHVPFIERLDRDLVERAARAGQRWISTFAIHGDDDRATAVANAAAFLDAGGTLLYGTDLGNGDLPSGVNEAELAALADAGLHPAGIVAAMTDPWPAGRVPPGVTTFVPGPPPTADDAVPAWLSAATVVPTEELLHDDL